MSITLSLSPELHAQLEAQAKASGQEVDSFIADALEAVVIGTNGNASPKDERVEDWLSRFDDWASRRRTYNPHFDDSRESIYPDRT